MGLFSAYQQKKAAEQNTKDQQQIIADQNAANMASSTPYGVTGPGGNVEFDNETNEMIQTLAPEYQDLMSQYLGLAGGANSELQGMMNDPFKMEQDQFQRFEDLNANAYAQSRMQGQEAALASGRIGGTQGYYDKLATEDAINQSRLGGQMNAIGTGMDYRQMLAAESLGFGGASLDVAGMLTPQADLGSMVGARRKLNSDFGNVSAAATNANDTTSGFWSGLADKSQDYNFSSMFTNKGGNAARAIQRASNPTVKSNLFNQGKIGNNQFGGNY